MNIGTNGSTIVCSQSESIELEQFTFQLCLVPLGSSSLICNISDIDKYWEDIVRPTFAYAEATDASEDPFSGAVLRAGSSQSLSFINIAHFMRNCFAGIRGHCVLETSHWWETFRVVSSRAEGLARQARVTHCRKRLVEHSQVPSSESGGGASKRIKSAKLNEKSHHDQAQILITSSGEFLTAAAVCDLSCEEPETSSTEVEEGFRKSNLRSNIISLEAFLDIVSKRSDVRRSTEVIPKRHRSDIEILDDETAGLSAADGGTSLREGDNGDDDGAVLLWSNEMVSRLFFPTN
jgi:hypothetical protein